jgi:hypothetical protein
MQVFFERASGKSAGAHGSCMQYPTGAVFKSETSKQNLSEMGQCSQVQTKVLEQRRVAHRLSITIKTFDRSWAG